MLRHLVPVLCEDEPVDDHVLEGRLVEERGGEHHEGVEPAACLVKPFRDEVGRKVFLDELLVFEGVVALCVWH